MIRIFVNQALFSFIKGTDSYIRKNLKVLSREKEIEVVFPTSFVWSLKVNLYNIWNCSIKDRLDKWGFKVPLLRYALGREFEEANCDVLFTQGDFPIVPKGHQKKVIFWETTLMEPSCEMGDTSESARKAFAEKVNHIRQLLSLYNVVINFRSDYSVKLAIKYFGREYERRFCNMFFLLPSLQPLTKEEVVAKHGDDNVLRLLFVGADAKRKNLNTVVDSFLYLKENNPDKEMELYIVSKEGETVVPGISHMENIHYYRELPYHETLALFRKCHIYFMPSHIESFGLSYVEGLANGLIIIARDYEPQREILAYGRCGYLVNPKDKQACRNTLDEVIHLSRERRIELALAGFARYQQVYDYKVVYEKWRNLFLHLKDIENER